MSQLPAIIHIVLILFCFLLPPAGAAPKINGTTPPERPGWSLVWHDAFEGKELDRSKWRVEHAALEKNNEAQFYDRDEVYLEDGCLVLRSRKIAKGGRAYTSGLVESKGKFAQTFGRFEVRARLPGGQGIWPAHWMLPASGQWPPEIDIMELLGHEPHTVHMTNHYGTWPDNRLEGQEFSGPDFTAGFHTFALEWEPGELRWYVDGVQRFATTKNVPEEPFFIILNTAVGGDWPGYPDETTVFPQYHLIDYVRVYALDMEGYHYLTTFAENGRIEIQPRESRYPTGKRVTLRAIPDIGYRFSEWSGDGWGNRNPVKLTIKENQTIRAVFEADPDAPPCISEGSPVTVSSMESPALSGSNAVDGDPNTRWSSEFSDPQWIQVDLGKPTRVRAVKLVWETAYGRDYRLEASLDGEKWKTLVHRENGSGGTEHWNNLNHKARYLRVFGIKRGTRWGYSLFEFKIFG